MATDPLGIKLDKEIENKMVMKISFSRAIIHSKSQQMLDNHHDIFKIPESLHKLVRDKLARVVHGKQPEAPPSVSKPQQSLILKEGLYSKNNK
ncbi:DEP domain-containing protein 7-like [Salvelinus alpinus]